MKNTLKSLVFTSSLMLSAFASNAMILVLGNPIENNNGNGTWTIGCQSSDRGCAGVYANGGHIYATFENGHTYQLAMPVTGKDDVDESNGAKAMESGSAQGIPATGISNAATEQVANKISEKK